MCAAMIWVTTLYNKFEHAAIASWMTFGATSTFWAMIPNLETKNSASFGTFKQINKISHELSLVLTVISHSLHRKCRSESIIHFLHGNNEHKRKNKNRVEENCHIPMLWFTSENSCYNAAQTNCHSVNIDWYKQFIRSADKTHFNIWVLLAMIYHTFCVKT